MAESGALVEKADAVALLTRVRAELASAPPAGAERANARVVRRYVRGEGWQFLVQVRELDSLDAARMMAVHMVDGGGTALVLEPVGGRERIVETLGSPLEAAPAVVSSVEGEPAEEVKPFPPADAIVQTAVINHGGAAGGGQVLSQAKAVGFVFDRKITGDEGPIRVHNRYFREGEALRLEVYIREGTGKDSVTVLSPEGKGWIIAEGQTVPRDASRVRDVAMRFSPEEILAVSLGIAEDMHTAGSWTGLRAVALDEDGAVVVLRPPEGAVPDPGMDGLVEATFHTDPVTLASVTWSTEGGRIRFSFSDYRAVTPELVVPFKMEVHQDETKVEEIEVHELQLDPTLPEGLFVSPVTQVDTPEGRQ
jgi:hypothetical protein